jgi:hypothetical protein
MIARPFISDRSLFKKMLKIRIFLDNRLLKTIGIALEVFNRFAREKKRIFGFFFDFWISQVQESKSRMIEFSPEFFPVYRSYGPSNILKVSA